MLWLDLGEYRGPSHFHAFLMFCAARNKQRNVELAYRSYVCDSLQAGAQGLYLTRRFVDLITPRKEMDVDEIIEHVVRIASSGE